MTPRLPIAAALIASVLLPASPAGAQSSLGGQTSLPPPQSAAPPRAAAPSAGGAKPPAGGQTAAPAKPAAPQAAAPAKPPGAAAPASPAPPRTPPATAAGGTPTVQPRPGGTGAQRPSGGAAGTQRPAQDAARRRPGPAAPAAGAAAGAAAGTAKPPEPPPAPEPPPKPAIGPVTNLPLPRFAALGSNLVNLRVGPDLRYRIEWTYQRRDLPVQIVDEYNIWRRIRDPEGTEGWVQRPLLSPRRTFLVQGEERVLRRRPEPDAAPVARLKPGVIGAIRHCEAGSAWCEARVGDYTGWIRRSEIWGVSEDEAIN